MSQGATQSQQDVVAWFDQIYKRKASRYLRPGWAYRIFPRLLETQPGDTFLDVACGTGLLLRAAREHTLRLYGIDISAVAVALARKELPKAEIQVGNAEALPYSNGTFDRITCLGSLERMLDVEKGLREMRRVGSDRARFCFMVRNSNTRSWRFLARLAARQRFASHAGADNLDNWGRLFESCGYRVLRVLPDQYPMQRRARLMSAFRESVDYTLPIASRLPLDRANEFIFVLEKGQ